MKIELRNMLASHPHIRTINNRNCVIFHYSRECTYDKIWDNLTRMARGIVFDNDGNLLARPWEKFFNLGEMPETQLDRLLTLNNFYISKKLDGSMGILYKHGGEYFITTKGSLESEQGQWGTEWLRKNVNLSIIDDNLTYIFEIIYPSNKIVIDYSGKEALILTGVIDKGSGLEVCPDGVRGWAKKLGTECVKFVEFNSIRDVLTECKGLVGEEGFVITFPNIDGKDLKVKIKGDWYLTLHRMISNLTPLAFWSAWDYEEKSVKKEYLMMMPEEFEELSENLSSIINDLHIKEYDRINKLYDKILNNLETNDVKHFAIECQKNYKNDLGILISKYKGQNERMWMGLGGIHRRVRPTGNILSGELMERVNRVIETR